MARKEIKNELHPKNLHCGRYDFLKLTQAQPVLANYVPENKYGDPRIDFPDPNAVKELNRVP